MDYDTDLSSYYNDLEKYVDFLENKECEHPFAAVHSKCFGEINKCLKCGKDLNI